MFNKIINFFRKNKSPQLSQEVVAFETDSPLEAKFNKLLHDISLTEEEENLLVSEIETELLDFEPEVVSLPPTKKDNRALQRHYRAAVKFCHPDVFPLKKTGAVAWFNYVNSLYVRQDTVELKKALLDLGTYAAKNKLPPLKLINHRK